MKTWQKWTAGQNHGPLGEAGLAVLRVGIGAMMVFGHGLSKLPPGEGLIAGVGAAGMPAPEAMAWFVALGEVIGGALLALGLFTRLGAAWLVAVMGGAAFLVHGGDPLFAKAGPSKESAMLYLLPAIAFMLRGGGRYSLDALLFRPGTRHR